MAELISFTHTEAALREYGEAVAKAYKESLTRNNRKATGDLLDSVKVDIINEANGNGITVALDLASYWKFVEWDTRPHWPPRGSLLKWISAKPIIPSPDSRGRIPTPAQLDFLIRRKIAGFAPDGHGGFKPGGTKGTHDLGDSVDAINASWLPRIEEAVARDINEAVEAQIWVLFGRGA